jgi:erythronate-4-phosphate dehydrogenase
VPLTSEGAYPTWHMVDGKLLSALPGGQILMNASRGPVFSSPDLMRIGFGKDRIAGLVLDVFEGEPKVDLELVEKAEIATPHIAGYSIDGKVRATEMVLDDMCRFFGLRKNWDPGSAYPAPRSLTPRCPEQDLQKAVGSVVAQAYDILQDDANLRSLKSLPRNAQPAGFDRLRDEYRFRPEFRHFNVLASRIDSAFGVLLSQLGFQVIAPDGATW